MVFGSKKPAHKYNFHDDELLHDTAAQPGAWNSNLAGDAMAAVKLATTAISKGFAPAAKDVVSTLDINDPLSRLVSKEMVSQLWGSMLHPPQSYRGSEYQYRAPDGSNNNILYPKLGAADAPYAKTVQGIRATHGAKPDPGDLFDLLMSREGNGIESGSGLSSMLLCHATLIIHDIFRTDDENSNKSATSSYLDLAPLYGSDEKSQMEVRLGKYGLLKPDTFSETRLLRQPPGVCIYLIMYNRFHNHVAKQLREINENGRFSLPAGYDFMPKKQRKAAKKKLDHDLFNTARLITCGLYIQIAIHDYLRCLMLMHAKDTPFTLDPRVALSERNNKKGLQRGEGNMVSVEFNLLYRFHSPISNREAWWAEDVFVQLLRDQNMVAETDEEVEKAKETGQMKFTVETIKNGDIPVPLFRRMLENMRKSSKGNQKDESSKKDLPYFPQGLDPVGGWKSIDPLSQKPVNDNVYRFKRGPDGLFDDAQLAGELIRVMEDPICQFGANNVPKVFKAIEVLGILQARQWEVATLNEFREFFGMSRHEHFEDINSSPTVQRHLRDLYGDPDLVELYPGLFCEGEGRCLDPGVSCPGEQSTALWRAVFSDAVTLVRSDRFYTLDWNVNSLTAWGMKEVSSDPKINKGSVMHRLFQRALPGFFSYNSVHMWQPFYTPTMNVQLAQEQGYLSFLDLRNLEDQNGMAWEIKRVNGEVQTNFKDACKGTNGRKVRRRLDLQLPPIWLNKDWEMQHKAADRVGRGQYDYPWRGAEVAAKESKDSVEITDYKYIKDSVFGPMTTINWINPSILEVNDIPGTVLRDIMTKKWDRWEPASKIILDVLKSDSDWEQTFMDYFVDLSQQIRMREQREFQRVQLGEYVHQIDIVSDYAVPIVTRFIADFLGFWKEIKTPQYIDRPYTENQIYRLLENCQNFDSYDADPTKSWARRMAFRDSIRTLKSLAEKGIKNNEPYLFENGIFGIGSRSYGCEGDSKETEAIRKLSVTIVRELRAANFSHEEIVAFMLTTALDAGQKAVVTFTEVLAYFIDPEQHKITGKDERTQLWAELQNLAWKDASEGQYTRLDFNNKKATDQEIMGYVLEAQRFNSYMRIPRMRNPKSTNVVTLQDGKAVSNHTLLLLNLFDAYKNLPKDSPDFPESHKFIPTRDQSSYLIYGGKEQVFTRQLALLAITAMIKHAAQLKELRVAHDKLGRLKRVKTPMGHWCYATIQWDSLISSPITWNLRFNGVGRGCWTGGDNADQGHGQDQVVPKPVILEAVDANVDVIEGVPQLVAGHVEQKNGVAVMTSVHEVQFDSN